MLKLYTALLLSMLFAACENNSPANVTAQADSTAQVIDTTALVKTDTPAKSVDILSFARDSILQTLQAKDYAGLVRFMSDEGIRFYPYGVLDTTAAKALSRSEFVALLKTNSKTFWGYADGNGDSLILTIPEYCKRYVYDVPFKQADKTAIDKIIDPTTATSKIAVLYPHHRFVQFYFPGFNKQYEGMDWKSLTLVLKQQPSGYYLVAVVHNQWKI